MIPYLRRSHVAVLAALLLSLSACGGRRYATQYTTASAWASAHAPSLESMERAVQQDTVTGAPYAVPEHVAVQIDHADPQSWLGHVQQRLDSLCRTSLSETSQLGVYVYDLTDGYPIFAWNARHRMRPASCEKLVTCIALLDRVDASVPLVTEVRATGQLTDGVLEGDLYLAGDMDPLLSRADLDSLAAALHREGVDSVAGRVCELMPPYEVLPYGWGWCWDDDYGPLAAHLVDGGEGIQPAWVEALRQAGIGLQGSAVSEVSQQEGPTLTACSLGHTIGRVMEPLLKKSDNVMAECLFHRLAALSGHRKTARHQAAAVVDSLITRLGLSPRDYLIADGSGLSLYNYVTPELLVELLNHAYRTESVRQPLWDCLPVAGVDGTLAKRMRGTLAQGNVHAKTGTVEGVSSLSGYLTAANGHLCSFSIINQCVARTRQGQDFQDAACLLLCQ